MTVFPGCGHGHWRAASLLHGTGGTAVWSRSWWWRLWGIWGNAGAGTERTGLDFISKAHVIYRTHVSKLTVHLHTDSSSFWSSSGAPVDVQSLTNYFLPVVMPLWSRQWWPPMMQRAYSILLVGGVPVSYSHESPLLWFTYAGHMISWKGSPLTSSKPFERRVTQRQSFPLITAS